MDKSVFIPFWSSMVKSHMSLYFFLPDYVYKPTFLRSILTQQAFLEVVVGNVAKYKNTELVGMNDACEDVLSELGQSWGVAENRLSLPAFHELHTQRRARMHRQLNTAYILVQHYQTKASISDADDSMSLMNSFLTKIDPDVSLEEVAPILQKGLLPTIETMIRAWMVASTKALPTSDTVIEPTSRPGMQLGPKKTAAPAKVEPSPVPFIMPLRLIEWTDCLHEKGPSAKIAPGMPHDSQGPRRATNMLMALIYDWLNVQFNEWQAEKAEQELLSGVDQLLEEDATAANGASAGKKKSKKKKNKKAATETDKPLSEASNSGDGKDAAASNGVAATDKDLVAKDAEPAEGGKDDEAMVPIVTAEPVEGVTTTTVSWFVGVFGSYAGTCNIPQSICFLCISPDYDNRSHNYHDHYHHESSQISFGQTHRIRSRRNSGKYFHRSVSASIVRGANHNARGYGDHEGEKEEEEKGEKHSSCNSVQGRRQGGSVKECATQTAERRKSFETSQHCCCPGRCEIDRGRSVLARTIGINHWNYFFQRCRWLSNCAHFIRASTHRHRERWTIIQGESLTRIFTHHCIN